MMTKRHSRLSTIRRSSAKSSFYIFLLTAILTFDPPFSSVPAACFTSAYWMPASSPRFLFHTTLLHAKRNKRLTSRQDAEDLNRWYESVDADASPDDVFWEEMERQRLLNEIGNEDTTDSSSYASTTTRSSNVAASAAAAVNTPSSPKSSSGGGGGSVEATLAEYAAFCVSDNWLDEDLAWMMEEQPDDDKDHVSSLDEQLEEWEKQEEGDDFSNDEENAWMTSDEPWDHWGESQEEMEEAERIKIDPSKATEFLYNEDEIDEEELAKQEAELLERLSKINIRSRRLERARKSEKAATYFARGPDQLEGYDQMWVSAIDNACLKNLVGTFRNYGIQFADNFGDWQDGCMEDGLFAIEDVASYKARKVYNATGLPCIASRTSFEIEPIPNRGTATAGQSATPLSQQRAIANTNPRVVSGYRFNDVGNHVDYLCDALRPLSEPNRVTRFKTCLCYFDGEMEIFDYGVADVDLYFANSLRTFIPVSQAINEMLKTLELTFGLEYQKWLKSRVEEAMSGSGGKASMNLRDRVLKEGKVLPNDIIDVSAFMDSKVDVNLMDECAQELANRFIDMKPSKILTVATTGLVIALPMAKYLQVPVVYARKERNVVMADTYKAGYSSKTVGKNRELLVSRDHLDEDDRVLVIDDFLSSGSSQEALLRIVSEAGATSVGVGVLLEKVFDAGRQSLSGFNVPIHSLCRVASVKNGVIQLVEEEGFDRMQQTMQK